MSTPSPSTPTVSTGSHLSTLDFATVKRHLTGHLALVLDDDADAFGRMFLSLSTAGCPSTLARRWAQVDPAVQRTRPSLILFSTVFDRTRGAETIRRLRENPATASATLVAVAARESRRERHALAGLGCDGYVWKPADRYLFAMELLARTPRLFAADGSASR